MRSLTILPLTFAALAAAPAAADDNSCSAATAKPTSIAAIIAGEGGAGDCLTVSAIAWKGALYDDVAQIYAEPRPARAPDGRGNRVAYFPPRGADGEPLPPGGALPAEAAEGFARQARHVTVTGKLSFCRMGAVNGGRPPSPYIVDESACHHPGGTMIGAVAVAIDASPPVERLTAATGRKSARLAPLAADSAWIPRFQAAADELLPALVSGDPAQWRPLLGGQWLSQADEQAVTALLTEKGGAFATVLQSDAAVERVILGWSPALLSASDRADIAASPNAEALVCWSVHPDAAQLWPLAAFDADNAPGRPYACARITYSIRDGTPTWRAFVEAGAGGLAEPES